MTRIVTEALGSLSIDPPRGGFRIRRSDSKPSCRPLRLTSEGPVLRRIPPTEERLMA